MTVSVKPSPVFKGVAAKKLIAAMEKPADNCETFKKCKEMARQFRKK